MAICQLIILCRQGFEAEAAAEIQEQSSEAGCFGYCKTQKNQGWLAYVADAHLLKQLIVKLPFRQLIFARQWFIASEVVNLDGSDRVGTIKSNLEGIPQCGELELIHADTNDGKEISRLCKKLTAPLAVSLRKANRLTQKRQRKLPRLVILMLENQQAIIGYHEPLNASPWPDGILHLKSPKEAPSRSTLKLEEAWYWFVPKHEWDHRMAAGMRAVDLGAAPGGWTWQLMQRHMMVDAVDNGPMKGDIMASGQVTHLKEDGFKYHPSKKMHWLVCDMAQSPIKIADRMADWFINGWCEEAIFNLKLPMKKRYQEVKICLENMTTRFEHSGIQIELSAKHLYHDREEITVHGRVVH